MPRIYLPFIIYHLPLISHLPFARRTVAVNCELLIDNSLEIDNCELKIASKGFFDA